MWIMCVTAPVSVLLYDTTRTTRRPRCGGVEVRGVRRAMGSAAGTARGHQSRPTQDEMNGYFAVKKVSLDDAAELPKNEQAAVSLILPLRSWLCGCWPV